MSTEREKAMARERQRRFRLRHPEKDHQNYLKNKHRTLASRKRTTKEYQQRIKKAVVEKYGGHCANPNCKMKSLELLCVDHVYDDGAECRKRRGAYGFAWYLELHRKPRSDRLQILCYGCNRRKFLWGGDFSQWPSVEYAGNEVETEFNARQIRAVLAA